MRHSSLCTTLCIAALLSLTACGGGGGGEGGAVAPPPATGPTAAQLASAADLLSVTTFGADYALVDAVAREGNRARLERQFTVPPSNHTPIVLRYLNQYGYDVNADPSPGFFRRFAWWEPTSTAEDQLRQRVAYALTHVFVAGFAFALFTWLRRKSVAHADVPGMAAAFSEFQQSMVELGVSDEVTTFTISDFGRTLTSNGKGSDHGWGGHQMVMSGAVAGRNVYGEYPVLIADNALDVGRGRYIPTTSVDAFYAELALWFGIAPSELDLVLPNIRRFYGPESMTPPVGFMA